MNQTPTISIYLKCHLLLIEALAGRVADLCWAFRYGFMLERVDSLLINIYN